MVPDRVVPQLQPVIRREDGAELDRAHGGGRLETAGACCDDGGGGDPREILERVSGQTDVEVSAECRREEHTAGSVGRVDGQAWTDRPGGH